MATTTNFIEFVCSQIAAAGKVSSRKMFGDYMVYLDEKPVIMVCDGICYVKKLPAIEEMMRDAECGYPYKGGKGALYPRHRTRRTGRKGGEGCLGGCAFSEEEEQERA